MGAGKSLPAVRMVEVHVRCFQVRAAWFADCERGLPSGAQESMVGQVFLSYPHLPQQLVLLAVHAETELSVFLYNTSAATMICCCFARHNTCISFAYVSVKMMQGPWLG